MTVAAEKIKGLLDLYVQRKNAQGSVLHFSSLRLLPSQAGDDSIAIEFNGTHCGRSFAECEVNQLALRLFAPLPFHVEKNVVKIAANDKLVGQLITANDRVVAYPLTDNFRTILNKFGVVYEETASHIPAVMYWPLTAHPISEFEIDEHRGFAIRARNPIIDQTKPEKGVVIQIPCSPYSTRELKNANIALVVLAAMGLAVPFTEHQIEQARKVAGTSPENIFTRYVDFPAYVIPTDGEIGHTTLAEYNHNIIRFAIMEEPDTVAAKLATWAEHISAQPTPKAVRRAVP